VLPRLYRVKLAWQAGPGPTAQAAARPPRSPACSHRVPTRERGYDPGQYEAWLFETTAELTLTSPPAPGQPDPV